MFKKKPELLFTVVHPTARVAPGLELWWFHSMMSFYNYCRRPDTVEYLVVVHESNWREFNDSLERLELPPWGSFRAEINWGANTSNAQGLVGGRSAKGQIIIGSMDDLFAPNDWDVKLLDALFDKQIERDRYAEAVVHVSSGSPNDERIFIPAIFTKARFDRYGYCGHPAYESMFADNEFTDVARRDGVVIEAPEIKFEHRHPAFQTAKMDEVYSSENRREAYASGYRIYQARKACNFPPDPDWRLSEEEAAIIRRGTIACCLPGETFNAQWVAMWTDIYSHLFINLGLHVSVYFGHTSNVYCTRMDMTAMVLNSPVRPDYVLWIDDDQLPNREQISWMLADLEARPDVAGVMAWTWCDHSGRDQSKPWMMSCGMYTGEGMGIRRFEPRDFAGIDIENKTFRDEVVISCDWSGFPCCLFRTEVFEQLTARAFQPIVGDSINARYGFCSEDAAFFWRAKQAGLKFVVDLRCVVPHLKVRPINPHWAEAVDMPGLPPAPGWAKPAESKTSVEESALPVP